MSNPEGHSKISRAPLSFEWGREVASLSFECCCASLILLLGAPVSSTSCKHPILNFSVARRSPGHTCLSFWHRAGEEWICQPLSILLSITMRNRTSPWASLTAPALPDYDPTPLDRGQAAPNTLPSPDTWDGPSRLSSE